MPLDEKILGFSNRWYRAAVKSSVTQRLSDDLEIRMVTGPVFSALCCGAWKISRRCSWRSPHPYFLATGT
jgi:hypothetical protein